MAKSIFRSFTSRIALDLGTTRTRIWVDEGGLVVDEPTCLAIDERVKKVVAVGQDAYDMSGRVADHIQVYFPMENGLVDNAQLLRTYLKALLQKVIPRSYFFRPVIMASVAAAATPVDQQTIVDLLYSIGAKEVYLMPQPLAAAIGADVPIADASGSFVLHLGGGVVEGGVISFGSLVSSHSTQYAGSYLDQKIAQVVKEEKQMQISLKEAETLKKELVSLAGKEASQLSVGQDLVDVAPKEIMLESALFSSTIEDLADRYVTLMKNLLEVIPPELTTDVIDKGMLLTGGLAQLDGLDAYLVNKLGVFTSVVENPEEAVVKGLATALENLDLFKESLGYLN